MLSSRNLTILILIGLVAAVCFYGKTTTAQGNSSMFRANNQTSQNNNGVLVPIFSQAELELVPPCDQKEKFCVLPSRKNWFLYGYRKTTTFSGQSTIISVVPQKIGRIVSNFDFQEVKLSFEYTEAEEASGVDVNVCYCPL